MIIRIMASALVQCMARTQAGWITLAGSLRVKSSAAARLDIVILVKIARCEGIRRKLLFRYCMNPAGSMAHRRLYSQKSEPGFPGSPVAHPVRTVWGGPDTRLTRPASARCRPHG